MNFGYVYLTYSMYVNFNTLPFVYVRVTLSFGCSFDYTVNIRWRRDFQFILIIPPYFLVSDTIGSRLW